MAALPGIYTATKKDGSTYYRASITYLKKHISLGSFATEELASRTYREARLILDHAEITLSEYSLRRKYFEYHMSATEILKFDRDDLFFYASKKIQKKGGYLFVSDYGSQYSILSRYGIRPFSVYGRDYRMTNGDALDFRYSNILNINRYHGVFSYEKNGATHYKVFIHINGNYKIGSYASETSMPASREKNPLPVRCNTRLKST